MPTPMTYTFGLDIFLDAAWHETEENVKNYTVEKIKNRSVRRVWCGGMVERTRPGMMCVCVCVYSTMVGRDDGGRKPGENNEKEDWKGKKNRTYKDDGGDDD